METSAKVFANIIDKPGQPMMYPKPEFGRGKNIRNPFCEEKLIHVNFVKINQESLKRTTTRCSRKHENKSRKMAERSLKQTQTGKNGGYVAFCKLCFLKNVENKSNMSTLICYLNVLL